MEYGCKSRSNPNKEPEHLIQRTFRCRRFVYNRFLAGRKKAYDETGKPPTRFMQDKNLIVLKRELEWLKEPDKCALQNAVKSGSGERELLPQSKIVVRRRQCEAGLSLFQKEIRS